jgi:hypothetical protein
MPSTIIRRGYTFYRKPHNIRVPSTPTRRGHIRHISGKTIRVSSHRVTNRGLPGRGPFILPPMRSGGLYGWKAALPKTRRRSSLTVAMRHETPRGVFRRLQLLSRYLKRTARSPTRDVLAVNTAWVRRKF